MSKRFLSLLVATALLSGCGILQNQINWFARKDGLPPFANTAAVVTEGLEPRSDALTYSLPEGSNCPLPIVGWREAGTELPLHMKVFEEPSILRLKSAKYAEDFWTRKMLDDRMKQVERFEKDAVREGNIISIRFVATCAKEPGGLRVRMSMEMVRLGGICGITSFTLHWLDHGSEEFPSWNWSTTVHETVCTKTAPSAGAVFSLSNFPTFLL